MSEVVREGGRVEERGEMKGEGGSNHLYSYDIGGASSYTESNTYFSRIQFTAKITHNQLAKTINEPHPPRLLDVVVHCE